MSTGTIPSCPLSLTVETLSAWRDETLSSAELARVVAHLASCPACRGRLAQYDAIAAELRAQPIPAPEARLWDAVRASASSGARARRPTQALDPRAPRIWKGLATVAAVLLLLAGFGQVLRMITAGRGPVSIVGTPTAGPIASLHWQPATFPAGFELTQPGNPENANRGLSTIAVSPVDGDTAYLCALPQPGQGPHPLVWITHDRAAHWTRLTDVPYEGPIDTCAIEPDAHDPSLALVELIRDADPHMELWATFDGGHTWQPLPNSRQTYDLSQLTTIGTTTYAMRTENTGDLTPHLMASTDHLQTWTAIDADIAAAHDTPFGLWVNPATGELLAAASLPAQAPGGSRPTTLWASHDAGQRWTQLSLPAAIEAAVVVGRPTAGKPWVICAGEQQPTAPQSPRILCSTDGGQTWLAEPPLVPAIAANPGDIRVFSIGSDGALLAMAPLRWDAAQQRVGYGLYRLTPGARQWQALGPVPEPEMSYATTAQGGVLWAFTFKQMFAPANPDSYAIFVAAYP